MPAFQNLKGMIFSVAVICLNTQLGYSQTWKKEAVDTISQRQRIDAVISLKQAAQDLGKGDWNETSRAKIVAAATKYPHAFAGVLFDDWTGGNPKGEDGCGRLTNKFGYWEQSCNEAAVPLEVAPSRLHHRHPNYSLKEREVRVQGEGPTVDWEIVKVVNSNTIIISRDPHMGAKQQGMVFRNRAGRIIPAPDSNHKRYISLDCKTTGMKAGQILDLTPFQESLFIITGNKSVDGNDTIRVLPFVLTEQEKSRIIPRFTK